MPICPFVLAALAVAIAVTAAAAPAPRTRDPIAVCDVAWTSPGPDSSGSMPIGNGDIGANVWVEPDGDLLLLLSKTDAWDEAGRLVKLGRVRIRLAPNPFRHGMPFRQTLALRDGEITIEAGAPGHEVRLRVRADANHPAIRIDVACPHGAGVEAIAEQWRTADRVLTGPDLDSAYGLAQSPEPVRVSRDEPAIARGGRIVWCHRNTGSVWQRTLSLQGLRGWEQEAPDPILHRTFGCAMAGSNMQPAAADRLATPGSVRTAALSISALTVPHCTPEAWLQAMDDVAHGAETAPQAAARAAHRRWWYRFWNRSWIRVSGPGTAPDTITRGAALQRYISACAGRGGSPIKFNGSIFTVEPRGEGGGADADYRRWGSPYWFQNTRLAYWPMLASGDLEMMDALFRMYVDALPFARYRTRRYFGHDGAYFPETMHFWGAYANDNYGWERGKHPASWVENGYIRWYWSGALELVCMMLERYRQDPDPGFLRGTLLPLAQDTLRFYDLHHGRDARGMLRLEPAQALETWQSVVDPAPDVAGLRAAIDGMLGLGTGCIGSENDAAWRRLRLQLPDLPERGEPASRTLDVAGEVLGPVMNSENPELYAVFPYRLFGVDRPGLDIARRTFAARQFRGHNGWRQDEVQAACLGLAHEAAEGLAERFASKHAGSRFPAFWGPNFDWVPDQDHGCAGMLALQQMLVQPVGDRIVLLPAWPRTWDVAFRLHAPRRTVVECEVRGGRVVRLRVTPASRRKDVTIAPPQ